MGKELDQIISLLHQTKELDPVFDYSIGYNKFGYATAIVWQDSVMLGHAKLLLDVVMIDKTKRQQNSANWCYCGPCGITGDKKIACFVEAIMIAEEHQDYVFIMNSLYEKSGVDRSVTKLIFGD